MEIGRELLLNMYKPMGELQQLETCRAGWRINASALGAALASASQEGAASAFRSGHACFGAKADSDAPLFLRSASSLSPANI